MRKRLNSIAFAAVCVILFLFAGLLHSQVVTFQHVYPADYRQSGRDAIPTQDGGYLIIAMTENSTPGDSNIFIIKTNHAGETVWTKIYGGNQPEYPWSVLQLSDGSFFVAGYTMSYGAGSYDGWLLKLDVNGEKIWDKTYGGTGDDQIKEIIPTSDGNFMLVGRSNSPGNQSFDAYLKKIDPSGNELWTKNYGGTEYETARSVKQCSDGGFIFTGQTTSYGSGLGDVYLVRTNAAGDMLWSKTYGGTMPDDGNAVVVNSDGSFVFTAETSSSGAGEMDVQVMKVDADGNEVWNKLYGGNRKDVSKTLQPTFDGGYIVGAISRSFGWITPQMWLLKLNSSGDTIWERNYGWWDHEHCHSARQTADGGYISVGHSKSFGGYPKVMFLKVDGNGTSSINDEAISMNDLIDIYPNPSHGSVTLDCSKIGGENVSVNLVDFLGRNVFSKTLDITPSKQKETINLGSASAGVYFLSFTVDNRRGFRRIIIE